MVKVLGSRVVGPLELHATDFATDLYRQGYTGNGASQHICLVAHLSRWMASKGLEVAALTPRLTEKYFESRRVAGYTNCRSARALQPLLNYLRSLGILPPPEIVGLSPADALLEDYRRYLIRERGLTAGTARVYVNEVRAFVVGHIRADRGELADLRAGDVTDFMLRCLRAERSRPRKLQATALRSLLRWLHVEGLIPATLLGSVLSVAGWRLSTLPRALEPHQLERLLASCDRRSVTGRRDFAIMLLLSRLGLRRGEVARLTLDDIDWRVGEMVLRGKGNRDERLPIPIDVGEAINDYLHRSRPCSSEGRNVFVRVKAPPRGLTPGAITMVVFEASKRAGLDKLYAHRLRHTAATAMLRAGTPLTEVGQVLRHRQASTTAIYAKVDRDALRVLARPWPGVVS
jgi:integrase/recombinase XerD